MLCAEFMVVARYRPFQEAPDVLNGVGMGIFHNIFTLAVRDRLMLSVMVPDTPVRGPVVGVDGLGFVIGGLLNEIVQGLSNEAVDNLESGLAATLDGSNNDAFVAPVTVADALLSTTYPSFIHLNLAAQFRRIGFGHGIADAVAEIPRGLVRDPDGSLDLVGRDAFLRLNHQVDGEKPFPQRKMAIMEDSACRHGKMVAA